MAQVVQPDRWQPRRPGQLPEDAGEPVRGHRVAAGAGEHVAAVVVLLAERGAFGLLGGLVLAQDGNGRPVQ